MTGISSDNKNSSLRTYDIQPEVLLLVSETIAREYNVIPLEVRGNVLKVAMANPDDILAIEALAALTKMRIEPQAVSAQAILEAIDSNYHSRGELIASRIA